MILKLEKPITIELSLALICVLRRKDGIMDPICMDGYIYELRYGEMLVERVFWKNNIRNL